MVVLFRYLEFWYLSYVFYIMLVSLLQKQRRPTEQYYIMCHIQRLYGICSICNMVSCVSARGFCIRITVIVG